MTPEDALTGRPGVKLLALVVVPVVDVIAIYVDGIARSGHSDVRRFALLFFGGPPLIAFALAIRNDRRLLRAVALAAGALVMIAVAYVVLLLPAAVACSAVKDGSCL
jgi:hypothetical protein